MSDFINNNVHLDSFNTLKRWLENRNKGKTLDEYFKSYGYKTIGIYGAGDLGNLVYEELKNSDIEIAFFVDRNAEGLHEVDTIPVISVSEISSAKKVDVLLITPIGNYEEISKSLAVTNPELPTMSLREAVYEL